MWMPPARPAPESKIAAVKQAAYWLDTIGETAETPSPSHVPDRADVAIVGAGYTGLAAARRLALGGASVAVIESGDVGAGASSRNGGQVLTGLKVDASALVSKYGEARGRELFDVSTRAIESVEAVLAEEQIECGYARAGHIQAAAKPSHFAAFRAEQSLLKRVFRQRVELVSRDEQRSELGSDRYHGLLVDPASRAINPAQYVCGLAGAARRAGATIVTGTPVAAVTRQGAGWQVTTARGVVIARDVLIATNGYTGHATPALARRFVPIGSYIITTEPLGEARASALLPRNRMAFDSKHFLVYFRRTADHRLLFGGRAEFSTPDAGTTRRAAAILRRGMIEVFPELAEARLDYAWGGHVAFTRDQMPHAGRLDGMYYAGGYCGHGIAMATHLGDQIARRIAGERVEHPLFDDRFAPIPLYAGRPWFLPFAGAYYRAMDWLQ
jgi:glycine/D-amino acid oxidase-like deaminating enzyme